jgi:hypothetical protein
LSTPIPAVALELVNEGCVSSDFLPNCPGSLFKFDLNEMTFEINADVVRMERVRGLYNFYTIFGHNFEGQWSYYFYRFGLFFMEESTNQSGIHINEPWSVFYRQNKDTYPYKMTTPT